MLNGRKVPMLFNKSLLILTATLTLLSGCSSAAPALPLPDAVPTAPAAAAVTEPAPPEIFRLKLSAVGDIMCHTLQYTAVHTKTGYDFRESFSLIKPELADSDLVIGNLETTFSGAEKTYSEYPTFNTPDAFAEALAEAGVDIVTTANNHSLDRRFYGLSRTLDVLDKVGLKHTGTFRTKEEDQILLLEQNHIRLALMAYSYGTNGLPLDPGKEFSLNLIDEAQIRSDIASARSQGAELIIVALHFGQEYQQTPNDAQKSLVAACFNEGADIVLGTHPHVVQSQVLEPVTDKYGETKNRFVAYSLGNFISAQRTQPRDAGVIAHLEIMKQDGVTEVQQAAFVPTWMDQSTGAGLKMFRVLPVRKALENPERIELLTEKDIFKLNRSLKYVTEALGI